jgi:hypothetical protein
MFLEAKAVPDNEAEDPAASRPPLAAEFFDISPFFRRPGGALFRRNGT